MSEVRIRHRGVLPHDEHAADLPAPRGLEDLDHRQPGARIEGGAPQRLHRGARGGVVGVVVVGQHHRDQPGIGGALHVVLPAQGMQPRARLADMPAHQREGDQRPRIVRPVHGLGDAHAPQRQRGGRGRVAPRDAADLVGRHAAARFHRLRRIGRDMGAQPLDAVHAPGDEGRVVEVLGQDDVQHGVEQRDVLPGREAQHLGREAIERTAARIGGDEHRPARHRVLQEGRRDGVVLGRPRADQEDQVGILHRGEGRRHRAAADPFQQRGDRGGVAEPRAVIDVVGPEPRAHELLEQIRLLVRPLGTAEAGERAGPGAVADAQQAGGGAVHRFLPRRLAELRPRPRRVEAIRRILGRAVDADQRRRQTVGMREVVEAEAALHAKPSLVGRAVAADHFLDAAVPDAEADLAADAAIGADARDLPQRRRRAMAVVVEHRFRQQRPGRTGLYAFPATHAGRRAHRIEQVEGDRHLRAAMCEADDVVVLHLAAGALAQPAGDAGVECDGHGRMREIR